MNPNVDPLLTGHSLHSLKKIHTSKGRFPLNVLSTNLLSRGWIPFILDSQWAFLWHYPQDKISTLHAIDHVMYSVRQSLKYTEHDHAPKGINSFVFSDSITFSLASLSSKTSASSSTVELYSCDIINQCFCTLNMLLRKHSTHSINHKYLLIFMFNPVLNILFLMYDKIKQNSVYCSSPEDHILNSSWLEPGCCHCYGSWSGCCRELKKA